AEKDVWRLLSRHSLAQVLWRARRHSAGASGLPAGVRTRPGASASQHAWAYDRWSDAHGARHRGAEKALYSSYLKCGGDLVPGLLRAQFRVGSRLAADPGCRGWG